MKKKTKQEKINSSRVDAAFNARCNNIQIGIMDLPKIMRAGLAAIEADPAISDAALGDKVAAFVETVRHN